MSEALAGMSFEDAVARLEDIVSAMEAGSLPLDECLRRFEQAVGLSRFCAAKLEAAEQQIRVLSSDGETNSGDHLPWIAEASSAEVLARQQPLAADDEEDPFQTGFDWDA
jgi:exodeoxyribonuclease VII small subunit